MSINRGMDKKDVIHIYSSYSAIKKNEIMPFAARWMDRESVILSEVKSEKEKYCVTSLICGIEKEMIQMNLQN